MSVTLDADDYQTNNNEYGLLMVDVDLVDTKVTKDTVFEFMLPNVDSGSYADTGCFIYTKDNAKISGLEYLKTSNSWFKKDEGYKIDGKIPRDYAESFNIVCHVKAPSSSVAEKKASFKIGDNSTEFTVTIVQNQIANSVKYLSTGDLSKSGLRIKADKVKSGFSGLFVAGSNIEVGAYIDKKCDYKLNGNTFAASITSTVVGMFINLGEDVAAEKSLSLTCSSDSGVSSKKVIPGFPSLVGLNAGTVKSGIFVPGDQRSIVLAEMENSTVSVATGVAAIAVVASALALFF